MGLVLFFRKPRWHALWQTVRPWMLLWKLLRELLWKLFHVLKLRPLLCFLCIILRVVHWVFGCPLFPNFPKLLSSLLMPIKTQMPMIATAPTTPPTTPPITAVLVNYYRPLLALS